jgi:ribose transport system substrate-binding protein
MIRGAVEALRHLGKTAVAGEDGHVVIVGHDGTPLALNRIREGVQDGTVVYDAIEMGNTTADNIIAFFAGEDFPKDTIIDPFIADSTNVDDDSLWGNLPALN